MSITLAIVILTGIISYQALNNASLMHKLKHLPYAEHRSGEYYRLVTSGLVHGSLGHLLINMYVLFTFGGYVEDYFVYSFGSLGRLIFLVFYFITIVIADLPTFFQHKDNPHYAAVGASGAVSGIIFIFILLNPWSQLSIIFLPFLPFPAILGGIVYLIYTTWAAKNARDNIGHSAHLFGALFGMLFIILLKPEVLTGFIDQLTNGWPY